MKVLVTGSTGFVGSALVPFLTSSGHTVTSLVRPKSAKPARAGPIVDWDPEASRLSPSVLESIEAVVHLAGENIAAGRWNDQRKARIRDSRVRSTRLLAETLARMSRPPKTFVCASAVGYYGDRGEERLTEQSPPGTGFLPDVCQQWEASTKPAAEKGIRVVNLRTGIVLSPSGGALAKMLTPFRLGGGGVIGDGRQYMSWISLDDMVRAIYHVILNDTLHGPANTVAPNPVTNREFTKTLGRVLGRPTVVPMPAFAARLAFGEMGDALLLASARVEPQRLLTSGYKFRHPELEGALRHLLGK
jgi:uncharacterized protein (TIGR01777 family)